MKSNTFLAWFSCVGAKEAIPTDGLRTYMGTRKVKFPGGVAMTPCPEILLVPAGMGLGCSLPARTIAFLASILPTDCVNVANAIGYSPALPDCQTKDCDIGSGNPYPSRSVGGRPNHSIMIAPSPGRRRNIDPGNTLSVPRPALWPSQGTANKLAPEELT